MKVKPRVILKSVADRYAGPGERIIEYSNGKLGGLISIQTLDDGCLNVCLYRHDPEVFVHVSKGEKR